MENLPGWGGRRSGRLGGRARVVATVAIEDLIAFNESNRDREMPFFGQERFLTSQARSPLTDPAYVNAVTTIQRMNREEAIDALAREHQLDAIAAPTRGPAWLTDHVLGDRLEGGLSAGPAANSALGYRTPVDYERDRA